MLVPREQVEGMGNEANGAGGHIRPADLLATVIKWRWLILGVTALALVGAIVVSLLTDPVYQASTTLEINHEPMKVTSDSDQPVLLADQDFLATQVGLLRSRSLSERVSRSLGLAGKPGFGSSDKSAGGVIRNNLTVVPPTEGRLVEIKYMAEDPGTAARIANAIAKNYIDSNLERQFSATSYARQFLNDRIASTKTKLEQSERALAAYARQAGIINLAQDTAGTGGSKDPTSASTSASQLRSLNELLATAEAETIRAKERADQAQSGNSI